MTKFKELLKSRYKNQAEAAKDLGFSTATISEWVNGGKKPSFANAKILERRLGIPREQIRPDIFGD
jgi:transcriptional regulator with XRE-family HTH domain